MKRSIRLPLAALVLMIFMMRWQGAPLTRDVRGGILAFEFAGSAPAFRAHLDRVNRDVLLVNIWLDFVFIAVYVWFFIQACRGTAGRFARVAWPRFFARLALLAGVLDVTENAGMLACIYSAPGPYAPAIVYGCALAKFALLAALLLFLFYSWLFRRRSMLRISE